MVKSWDVFMIQRKYCEFTLYYIYNFKILVHYFRFRAYKIVLILGEDWISQFGGGVQFFMVWIFLKVSQGFRRGSKENYNNLDYLNEWPFLNSADGLAVFSACQFIWLIRNTWGVFPGPERGRYFSNLLGLEDLWLSDPWRHSGLSVHLAFIVSTM